MAINFPDSPTSGDTHTVGDKTWTWNGTSWDVVVSTPISNQIIDADGDTRIQVEESPDEDYIRFDTAGTERMTIGPTGDVAVAGALAVTGALSGTTVTSIQSDISTAQSDITTLETDVTNINELQLNAQSASYTLVLSDAGKLIQMAVSSANTLTVPPNSSVAFPVGTQILVIQQGTGQTTITAGAGVSIFSKDGNLKTSARYSAVTLIKREGGDNWYAIGDLTA